MSSYWCSGLIKGDPDIAGIGVVISTWIASAASLVTGTILWYITVVQGKSLSTTPFGQKVLKCAFTFSDTALVTMLAIISSSVVFIKSEPTTSLYHVFIARCLAQTCQIGVFSSVPFYDYQNLSLRGSVGANTRLVLYIGSIVLWIYWTCLCLAEFNSWRAVTPSCFYNDSLLPGWYTHWMYLDLIWTPSNWLWYLLETWKIFEGHLKTINKFVPSALERMMGNWQRWYKFVESLKIGQRFILADLILRCGLACIFAFYVVGDILACSMVSIFVAPPSTAPVTSFFWLAWSVYDIKTVWQANTHIVVKCPTLENAVSLQGNTNPESDWGFGQLLPMFLILLPVLAVVDSFD